jgi:hypothetical protein
MQIILLGSEGRKQKAELLGELTGGGCSEQVLKAVVVTIKVWFCFPR